MRTIKIALSLFILLHFFGCSNHELEKQKGISLAQTEESENINDLENNQKFNDLKTKPGKVLLTGNLNHRLISVFKVNYSPKNKEYFTGSNAFHRHYYYNDEYHHEGYRNFMPGLCATYGYNMLNVSHYNLQNDSQNTFFTKPVLIKTLYYPSASQDSINNKPVNRNYYLVTAYNQDTNNDSIINHNDLRRLFHFDVNGNNKTQLIPSNYSVIGSEYDDANDHMIIRARIDTDNNGQINLNEATHVFWVDLKKPKMAKRVY